jgi:phosphoribosyl 1,2-cyclic phosphodiesterase
VKIRFWGTRGSIPTPGQRTVRYGGNTACVEVRDLAGHLLVLDAGTGLRELGLQLNGTSPLTVDLLLSHLHWDHIQGIPFFAPIFQRGNHFTIWGARSMQTSIDRVVRDQMSPVVFPVTFEQVDAVIDFREMSELEECPGTGGNYTVRAFSVRHPGGALGYRFAERHDGAGALVYISDNELSPHAKYDTPAGWRSALVDFVRGADVLVHDAMYTVEEYDHHRGWGHSTYGDAVALAIEARVKTLVLFHHKPERSDDELDRRVEECRAAARTAGSTLSIIAAAEGLTLSLGT